MAHKITKRLKVVKAIKGMKHRFSSLSAGMLIVLLLGSSLVTPSIDAQISFHLPGRNSQSNYIDGEAIVRLKDHKSRRLSLVALNASKSEYSIKEKLYDISKENEDAIYLVRADMPTAELLKVLASDPDVLSAEPNPIVPAAGSFTPNDPFWPQQAAAMESIRVPELWNELVPSVLGNRVRIAVIDSAKAFDNFELSEKAWLNPLEIPDNGLDDDNNGTIDDYRGVTFLSQDEQRPGVDTDNHGHNVSGVIGAQGNNGELVAGIMFPITNVHLIPLQVINSRGGAGGSDILKALSWVITNARREDIKVVNLSLAPAGFRLEVFQQAFLQLNELGIAVVIAAGNFSDDIDILKMEPIFNLPNVIVVGGSQGDQSHPSSSYGIKSVPIYAPFEQLSVSTGNGLGAGAGTSVSAPAVSATLAYEAALRPDLNSAHLLIAQLLAAANRNHHLQHIGTRGGLLDVYNAVRGNFQLTAKDTLDFRGLEPGRAVWYKKNKLLVVTVRSSDPAAQFALEGYDFDKSLTYEVIPDPVDGVPVTEILVPLKKQPGTVKVISSSGAIEVVETKKLKKRK